MRKLLNYAPLRDFLASLRKLLKNRWLRNAIRIVVYLSCIVFLVGYLRESQLFLRDLKPDYWMLFLSFVSICGALFLGATGWYLTLRGLDASTSHRESSHVFYWSNLTKYVPGYVWQYVSRAQMTHQLGISNSIIATAMPLEFVLLIAAGGVTVLISVPLLVLDRWISAEITTLLPIARALAIIGLIVLPLLIPNLLSRLNTITFKRKYLVAAIIAMQIGWMLTGVGLWFIYAAVADAQLNQLPLFVFAMAFGFIVGLMIFIIPGSIGVREGMLVYLLTPFITAEVAIFVAAMSRVIYIMVDLTMGLISLIWTKLHQNNPSYTG